MRCGSGKTVVVAEDDLESRSYLETALLAEGFDVRLAEDGEETLRCLEQVGDPVSLVLLDVVMPRKNGVEALQEIRRRYSDLPVIVMSGGKMPAELSRLLDRGTARFLEKPLYPDVLTRTIRSLLHDTRDRSLEDGPGAVLARQKPAQHSYMKQMESMVAQVGVSDVPVLLQGETGVGKEVMARQLHNFSKRAKRPFIKVNCAALPSELVESELFGYDRGAFTGAFKDRPGRFELAQGGTILLDEIGDMDVRLQAKLLQVLQDGEFHRLGSREVVRVDVRVMAATHQDLQKAIRDGRFREDLYYRLNVINIKIPPLRERPGEILWLAENFLDKHRTEEFPPPAMTTSLEKAMLDYPWPGNIRELENAMRRFLVVRDPVLLMAELQAPARPNSQPEREAKPEPAAAPAVVAAAVNSHPPASALLEAERMKQEAERSALLKALESTHWNRKQAASLLDIDYKAFLYKMKKLGIGANGQAT